MRNIDIDQLLEATHGAAWEITGTEFDIIDIDKLLENTLDW
ncbi:hypothetical protein [Peribacillus sp. SCS-155]